MSTTTNISAIRKQRIKLWVIFIFKTIAFLAMFVGALYIVGAEHMSDEEFWNHAVCGVIIFTTSFLLYLLLTLLEAYHAGDFD